MAKHKSYPGGAAINAPWTAQKLRNRLVKSLGVTKEEVASITDQYRYVSGFVDLRRLGLPIIYVNFTTDRMAHDRSPEGYVRTATSLKDYTGGRNWWATWNAAEHQILKTARMGESTARPMRERPTEAQEAASLQAIEDWGKTVANPGGNSELDSLVRELKTASPNRRKMILVQLGEMFAAIYESRYPDETPAPRKDNTVAFRPRRNPSGASLYRMVDRGSGSWDLMDGDSVLVRGGSYTEVSNLKHILEHQEAGVTEAHEVADAVRASRQRSRQNPSRASRALEKPFWWLITGNRIEKTASAMSFDTHSEMVAHYTAEHQLAAYKKRGGFMLTSKKKVSKKTFLDGFRAAYPEIRLEV